jgi:hypothetical protein
MDRGDDWYDGVGHGWGGGWRGNKTGWVAKKVSVNADFLPHFPPLPFSPLSL